LAWKSPNPESSPEAPPQPATGGSGTPLLAGRHKRHPHRLSVALWEEDEGAKFHFLNNPLLAIVKEHQAGEEAGIFTPNIRTTFARQGKAQRWAGWRATPIPSFFCNAGNRRRPQAVELHRDRPSLAPTHAGPRDTAKGILEREARASSRWGQGLRTQQTKLQGSQFWTKMEPTPKPTAHVLQCINAV